MRGTAVELVEDSPRPGERPPFLEVTDISKAYGRQTALSGVSFTVAPGEIVGLVGPNGAGKSTTLRIICGLLKPDAGRVALDGLDQRLEPARCRSRLGALIEAPACYPSLTAFDHLAYVARIRGCYDPAVLERVLEEVGLPPRSKKAVRQFSLGMKQRLGIAMATLDAPGLLVLDEPMNGLDPMGMAELREQFELYHMERLTEHLPVRHALDAVPVLYFAVWKMMMFQAAVLAFAAFWATIDSQYGMVRVVGAQPLSRLEYQVGKWLGISGHVAVVTVALIGSVVGWAAIYSGVRGIGLQDVAMLLRFSVELLVLTLALGVVGMVTASFRRTVGSGMVTALIALIGLAVMTMLPFDVVPPRFVFVRHFFFPMQEFPSPFDSNGGGIFVRLHMLSDFYTVVIGTPLLLAIPAMLYFRRRDITE